MSVLRLACERFGCKGAETAIVFIHGHTSSKETWKPIRERFPEYDCLAVDLRGHGNSPLSDLSENDYSIASCVEDVRAIVEEKLTTSKYLFVLGHSMGSRIAVPYATTYPEKIRGVIIEDLDFMRRNPGDKVNISNEREEELKRFNRQFASLEECEAALLSFGYEQSYIDRWKNTDRIVANSDGFWSAIHPWVTHNCLFQILGTDGTADFRKLAKMTHLPVLLMLAESGSATSEYGVQKMKSIMRRLQMETFVGSTHSIHRTNPDDFVTSLNSFIQNSLSAQ